MLPLSRRLRSPMTSLPPFLNEHGKRLLGLAETSASEPVSSQMPATKEITVPSADPDKVFYFANALETGRIYRQSLDGSGLVLICDADASNVTEMGDVLCFISKDALCRCPVTGGTAETVFCERPVYGLCRVTDKVLLFAFM